jgi:hypothetical protein
VKECITCNTHHDLIGFAPHGNLRYLSPSSRLMPNCERAKIVSTQKLLGGAMHPCNIKLVAHKPAAIAIQGRPVRRLDYPVLVRPPNRVAPGMEACCDRRYRSYDHIFG